MILSGPPSRRRGLMSPWLPCFGAALLLSCAGTTYGTGDASDTLDRGAPDEDALARDVPEIAEDRRPDGPARALRERPRGTARHPGGQ
jgi:hypothetical protein